MVDLKNILSRISLDDLADERDALVSVLKLAALKDPALLDIALDRYVKFIYPFVVKLAAGLPLTKDEQALYDLEISPATPRSNVHYLRILETSPAPEL